MDAALPQALSVRLEALSEGRSGRDLAERAQRISAGYRSGAPSRLVIKDADDALAYALTRMPATYAATRAALWAMADRAPDFQPATLTDAGCGPGSASWAAISTFHELKALYLIDGDRRLLDLAARLLEPEKAGADFGLSDLDNAVIPHADLVVAAYVLTEMPGPEAMALAQRLWAASGGALVIVEPGTPRSWRRLMDIRSMLINMDGRIAAPCPHDAPCPIAPPDWCHFSQRLPRSRAHRLSKGAAAPFEDEKFIYLAAVRPGVALGATAPRVLEPPRQDKVAMTLKLCQPSGDLEFCTIARREKAAYRWARRAAWGDRVADG